MQTADLATVVVVVAIVAAAALALVGVLALARRRERRVIASLMARIEQLENQRVGPSDDGDAARHLASVGRAVATPLASAVTDESSVAPSADVLAGMTSRVRRLVASHGAAAAGLADQAIFRIQSNMQTNYTPGQLADALFVSLRTLERGLAVGLGCTPGQLILAMKMREARRLLQTGDHRVAEVADRLGFANPFHFSRRFKSFYRVAPSEVRQAGGTPR